MVIRARTAGWGAGPLLQLFHVKHIVENPALAGMTGVVRDALFHGIEFGEFVLILVQPLNQSEVH